MHLPGVILSTKEFSDTATDLVTESGTKVMSSELLFYALDKIFCLVNSSNESGGFKGAHKGYTDLFNSSTVIDSL